MRPVFKIILGFASAVFIVFMIFYFLVYVDMLAYFYNFATAID